MSASLKKPEAPVLDESMDMCVLVDSIPVVGADKYDKLIHFVKAKFAPSGTIVDIVMPKDESSGLTLGYLFIQYSTAAEAQAAIANMHGKPMDKTHIFKVSVISDFDKVVSTPDAYTDPDTSVVPPPTPFLRSWLLDRHFRDQFVIRTTENSVPETHIFFNDPLRKAEEQGREWVTSGDEGNRKAGRSWTELGVQWSPAGSYLVTFHLQGIALWGAAAFSRINKFAHAHVQELLFSPCERYLLTASAPAAAGAAPIVKAWSVASGALLRQFDDLPADKPVFSTLQWSFDGKYLARVMPKGISVYEAPAMTQLDNKAIAIPNVTEVAWCPTRNLLAYSMLDAASSQSVVAVMDIPSRRLLAEKHKFEVVSATLHWQASGKYLASYVTRRKGKKAFAYSIDFFNMSKRDVPVEEVTLANPGKFAFDPVRPFFVCTAAVPAAPGSPVWKCEVSIYRLPTEGAVAAPVAVVTSQQGKGKKGAAAAAGGAAAAGAAAAAAAAGVESMGPSIVTKRVAVFTLVIPPNHKYDAFQLHWSPAGGHLVVAILAPAPTGVYLFDCSKDDTAPVMIDALEHDNATTVCWDPSGRFFTTAITRAVGSATGTWRDKIEDGYRIWSFQGEILVAATVEKLHQFLWRPRPRTALTAAQLAETRAQLKTKYWKTFDAEDNDILRAKKSEHTKRRQAIKSAWREYRARCAEIHKKERNERIELRHGLASDDEKDVIEVQVPEGDTIARLAL